MQGGENELPNLSKKLQGGAQMKRLVFLLLTVIVVLPLAFGGLKIANAAEPIKIGYLAAYTGIFAKPGQDHTDGFKLYLDEIGYRVAGRKIVFIAEDSESKPEVGPTKVRKLVEKDRVDILAGVGHSGIAYAIRDYVHNRKIPLMICLAGAAKLTQEDRSPYIFRASFANGQTSLAGGWYAYAKMGIRKVMLIFSDYAAGQEMAAGFKKTFKAMGGEVLTEIRPPLGTTDFGPYLANVSDYAGKVDRVWMFFGGSDAVRIITQYSEYGLKEKIKLFVEGDTVDETYLPSQKEAALGVENYLNYAFTLDTPENKRFTKIYREKFGYDPGLFSSGGYNGAKAIVEALKAVKGRIEDKEEFLKALRKVKFEAPMGPFRFDDHQNVVFNVYIRRVEKKGGKYVNVVTDTVPEVGQYWMPPKK
jgi:branched-chain amino acid transport system substrate-binding protein